VKALLVIDMQNAWLNRDTPRFDRQGVIQRINRAARHIRAQAGQVIFIQHCDSDAVPREDGWQLDAGLEVHDGDHRIDKTACDSFIDTTLLEQLQQQQATTLVIAGLATEFCVDTTVRAAVSLGFNVIALADAHTTGDRPHLSAEQIIEHHNWVWANLAAPAGTTLTVQTLAQMLNADEARHTLERTALHS
jgi:nicotinamidase-related amidase